MSPGNLIQFSLFPFQVGIQKIYQNNAKRNQSEPDSPSQHNIAQNGGNDSACHKSGDHSQVNQHSADVLGIFPAVTDGLADGDANLSDMVRTKSGRHGNPLRSEEHTSELQSRF